MRYRDFEAVTLEDLRLPYDRFTRTLDRSPRLVGSSSNVYAAAERTVKKRGGTNDASWESFTLAGRVDRAAIYRTEEEPAKVYVVASRTSDDVTWEMFYLRIDAGAPAWTTMGTLRNLNASTRAHEFVSARGKLYVKGFPSGGDKLGSVIFDGSGASPTTHWWGLLGPTIAARIVAQGSWSASSNPVSVLRGWTYAYAWKTTTGQYSNLSDLEFDPAQQPSNTTAITNLIPQVTVQGDADTTNIPSIGVFRTTDGGGTYYFLEDITNTGAGGIIYTDTNRTGTPGDPKTDEQITGPNEGPELTSNSPPPSVVAPKVVGTDDPDPSTPIVFWQGRLWYGLGSVLVYSGDEEILNGNVLECFPSGFFGNFFDFQHTLVNLIPFPEALIVITTHNVMYISGRSRDSFLPQDLIDNVGGAVGHPRAACRVGERFFYLANDLAIHTGPQDDTVSLPLGDDLTSRLDANTEIELLPHHEEGKDWIIAALHDKATPASSAWWVLDLRLGLWSPPWTGHQSTALASGQPDETGLARKLLSFNKGTATALTFYDESFRSDTINGTGDVTYTWAAETNLFDIPVGNEVHPNRRPIVGADFVGMFIEYDTGVTIPVVATAYDDDTGTVAALTGVDPPWRAASAGYDTKYFPDDVVCGRVKVKVSQVANTESFELLTVGFLFSPPAST